MSNGNNLFGKESIADKRDCVQYVQLCLTDSENNALSRLLEAWLAFEADETLISVSRIVAFLMTNKSKSSKQMGSVPRLYILISLS